MTEAKDIRSIWVEARQYRILTRHFFLRLFKNDIVNFEDQAKERLIGILSILAFFSGLVAHVYLDKYSSVPDHGQSALEKMFLITFFMLVMGFLAILEWDVMTPDRRDAANLSPLPLRMRTIFLAKFTSLTLFVGLFALSLNALSSPFFLLLLPRWRSSNVFFFVGYALIHFLVMFLACFFGFFFYVVLLGFFQSLLGSRLFRRISTYLRSLFLVIHFFLILLYLRIFIYGLDNLISTQKLLADLPKTGRFLAYFPPFWFTDLYEAALGNSQLPFHGRYILALIGLVVMIAIFVLTMGLRYGHSIRGIEENRAPKFRKIHRVMEISFNGLFLRNSTQRAVFHFTRKTLRGSVFHRMRLSAYVACSIALIPFLITLRTVQKGNIWGVNIAMASIPLIIALALLLGMKSVMNLPVSLEANWIFRLTEKAGIKSYLTGLRKAILFLKLGPLFVLIFAVYSILWNTRTAFLHSFFGFMISILVMEILFVRFVKIPFACSYLPGKEKIQVYWLPYLIGFFSFVAVTSRLELELLKWPSGFIIFTGLVFTGVAGIRIYQTMFLYKREKIRYEEEPEPVMVGLDYKRPSHLKED